MKTSGVDLTQWLPVRKIARVRWFSYVIVETVELLTDRVNTKTGRTFTVFVRVILSATARM